MVSAIFSAFGIDSRKVYAPNLLAFKCLTVDVEAEDRTFLLVDLRVEERLVA